MPEAGAGDGVEFQDVRGWRVSCVHQGFYGLWRGRGKTAWRAGADRVESCVIALLNREPWYTLAPKVYHGSRRLLDSEPDENLVLTKSSMPMSVV